MLDPEIRGIIKVRALFAWKLLFPLMKEAKKGDNFIQKLEMFKSDVKLIAEKPELLCLDDQAAKLMPPNCALIEEFSKIEKSNAEFTINQIQQVTDNGDDDDEADPNAEDDENFIELYSASQQVEGHVALKPSKYNVQVPSTLEEYQKTLISDAANSFI